MQLTKTNNVSFRAQARPRIIIQAYLGRNTGKREDIEAVLGLIKDIRNENGIPSIQPNNKVNINKSMAIRYAISKAIERQFAVLAKIKKEVEEKTSSERTPIHSVLPLDFLSNLCKRFNPPNQNHTIYEDIQLQQEVSAILDGTEIPDVSKGPIIKADTFSRKPTKSNAGSNVYNLDSFRKNKKN